MTETSERQRFVWVSIALAAMARVLLAPLRLLSPDEAYYLCAARRGWPIVDHPPLLGWLLVALSPLDRFGPIELRVRLIAIVAQALTAIAIGVLAGRALPFGVFLATWGLMSWVSGLIATPDAPLLAACAWLLVLRRSPWVSLVAFLAVLAKVSGLFFVLAVATTLRGRPRIAALLGAAAALFFAHRSLLAQVAHAAGRGALVSAPAVGRPLALLAFVAGTVALYGPALLYLAWRGRRRLDPAGVRIAWVFFALCVLSALLSGRPPEPNWIAPAFLPLLVAASVEADATPASPGLLWLHVAPALLGVALWVAPDRTQLLVRVPHGERDRATDLPPYARPAWACVYDSRCEEIDAIFRTSNFR